MIAWFIALAAQASAVPTLGPIGRQELPAHGCAAFLWSARGDQRAASPVAMASADPAMLRVSLNGMTIDLPRVAQRGEGGLGLATATDYRSATVTATLEITVVTRADLSDGAAVPQATLRLARAGQDELVVPLAGLIGCRNPS